jgi:indolepyruvate ferredoxin oxidoreductase
MKGLRGGALDIFSRSKHRKMERELIGWYRGLILSALERLTPENLPQAMEIAGLPDKIRGYERIKESSIAEAKKRATELLAVLLPEAVSVGQK